MWNPFKKKEEVVEWEDLSSFVNDKYSAEEQSMVKSKKAMLRDLEILKSDLSEALLALERAELVNPKISEKEKHFMAGNRNAYILRMSLFAKSLPEKTEDVDSFLANALAAFAELSKAVTRPFHILQEFFGDESKQVSLIIGKIESSVKLTIHRNKWSSLRNLIHELEQNNQLVAEFKKRELEYQEQIVRAQQEIKKAEQEYQEYLNSTEHTEMLRQQDALEKEQNELLAIKRAWSLSISGLSPLLKKLEHGSVDAVEIHQAIRDSTTMLHWQESRFIVFIAYLKKSVPGAALRDEKLKRVMQTLSSITTEDWRKTKQNVEHMQHTLEKMQKQLASYPNKEELLKKKITEKNLVITHLKAPPPSLSSSVIKDKIRQELTRLEPTVSLSNL